MIRLLFAALFILFAENLSTQDSTKSFPYHSYFEVTYTSGKVRNFYLADSLGLVIDLNDVAVGACIKFKSDNGNIYQATSFLVIFILGNDEPIITDRRGCFSQSDMEYFSELNGSPDNVMMFRNIKGKDDDGHTRSLNALYFKRKE
jgi:hypothetical protein